MVATNVSRVLNNVPVALNAANAQSAQNVLQTTGTQIVVHAAVTAKTLTMLRLVSTSRSCHPRLQYHPAKTAPWLKSQRASHVPAAPKSLVMKRLLPLLNDRGDAAATPSILKL